MTNKQSNSSLYTLTENDNFDLKRYLSLFFNNWYWFAVALFISLSIAYGINRWSEKYYTVSSSMLIRDDQFGGLNPGVANIFPGSEDFGNQQNLKNEIGILKSFMLNYKTLQSLKDFHVEYIEVGKRGIAEQRLYNKAPFKVVYGSLGDQVLWKKLYIRVKSETTYEIRIDGDNGNYYTYSFGERFNEKGFDFIIIPRDGGDSIIYNPDQSNKYYFYFQSPESLAQTYRQKLIVTPIEEDASLVTQSRGEGKYRKIVILPARTGNARRSREKKRD